jgi:PKD repeat protein/methionine-rich copper-binding protein CopC
MIPAILAPRRVAPRRALFLAAILAAESIVATAVPAFATGITFRAASSATNQATNTLQLPTPAGIQGGDVLLAGISVRTKPTITPPSGWSLVVRTESGNAMTQTIYVHVASASEPTSTTWTFSKAGSAAGGIVAYAGVDTTTPVDASAGQAASNSATITAPSVTTTAANDVLVAFFGIARTSNIVPASPLVERYDITVSTALKYKISSAAADEQLIGSGPTGPRTATGNAAANVGQQVALRPGGPPDTTAPTVTSTSPADGATDVSVGANVTATFSEAVTGVSGASFTLTGPGGSVAASVSYDAATRTATLNPTSNLAADTTYTANLSSAIKDSAGNALAPISWSFHTAPPPPDTTPPTVTNKTPANGATGVVVTTDVTATFSEDVTGISATTFTLYAPDQSVVPASLTYTPGNLTATLDPSISLASDTTYTAILTNAITDLAGNPLAQTAWSFHTATAPDTTPPTVTTKSPADGATGVALGSVVSATFSENVTGVDSASFTLAGPGGNVNATVGYSSGTLTASLDPFNDLAADTTYTATLTSAITDIAGNHLSTVTWSFHTAAPPPDTNPPTVTGTSPVNNATGVSTSANITATFSESVTGVSATTFTVTGPAAATTGTVTYDPATRTATFDPSSDLAADTQYTASLSSGIADSAGNPLSPTSWTFRTAAAPPPPSSITFKGATSAANTTTTTLDIARPAGTIAGDVLVGLVSIRTSPVITPPAGWSLVIDTQNGSTIRQAAYVHTVGASEPSTYTWTFSSAMSATGGILAYSGVDPITPIDSVAGLATASSATVTAPSITTKTANTVLIGYFGTARTTTLSESASMTERFDVTVASTVTIKISSAAADESRPVPGPTGTRTATTGGSSGNIGQSIALRQQGAPPGADFDLVPASGVVPLTVAFKDLSTGSPTGWAWDFDSNGTIDSTAQNPTYSYTTAGPKTVTLTVTGSTGSDSEVKPGVVIVDPVPTSSPSDPVLVGAGDIASCAVTTDDATAALLDGIAGTVFTTGDNVYESGTTSEWTNCYEPTWGRHKARTRPALGNHDIGAGTGSEYYAYFGANAGDPSKGYYSYDLGNWHIVVLNTECGLAGGCGVGSPQEVWLRQDLAANTSQCTLAYWHEPLFSSSSSGGRLDGKAFWDALIADGAELVLNGDAHVYERFAPQDASGASSAMGMREFVVGTGGRSHASFGVVQPLSQVRNNTAFGVLKLTLHANGYSWQFVPVAGQTFTDSGQGGCH